MEDMSEFEDRYRGWHSKISFLKSGIRLLSCFFCIVAGGDIMILAAGLGIAEILGIAEEIM